MNHLIICAFITMVVAQGLKIPFYYLKTKKLDWKIVFSTGALPSSHSAVVVSAMVLSAWGYGINSSIFAISFIFGMIVIHDAIKVRGESGKQAMAINILASELDDICRRFLISDPQVRDIKLKELIGHSYFEAIAGIVVGIIVSVSYALIVWPGMS